MNFVTLIILCFVVALITAFPETPTKGTKNKEPWKEFHTAAEYGNIHQMNELLTNGTDIDIQDGDGRTALYIAAKYDQLDVVEFLTENDADIDLKSTEGRTPIYVASSKGHERIVEKLIEMGPDVNMRTKNGWTPLHAAVKLGNERIAELLLENGANANYQNNEGETALFMASYLGHRNLTKTLLSHGANVNLQNNIGRTPLFGATLKGFEDIVKMLVQNGTATDVNIPNRNGNTPLHAAVDEGHEKIVEFLLQKGADATLKNTDGETPMDVAVDNENETIIKILKNFHVIRIAEKACKSFSTFDRISGGQPVAEDEIPWMTALNSDNDEENQKANFKCGGTVISKYFILTAAHCVSGSNPPTKIRLGKVSLNDEEDDNINAIERDVKKIITHPEYSKDTKKNDIALIEVEKRIPFSKYVKPACLNTDLRDEPSDVNLVTSGWGWTSWENRKVSTNLLKTQLKTMPLSECNEKLLNSGVGTSPFTSGLIKGQYCAYDPQQKNDTCKGDSGGPLQYFSNKTSTANLVGIVSFGHECANELPGVYTRVSFYLDWIVSHVWEEAYNRN